MLHHRALPILLAAALLGGCASAPPAPSHPESSVGLQVLAAAERQIGRPYRYGSAGPRSFDCSGLVQYAHRRAGLAVPRTTTQQFRLARRVNRRGLRPGDLLFFRLEPAKVSHVGIYAGEGRFVHAPSSGKRVSYGELDDPYWSRRLVAAGRLY